jgi:hypothetical protein
MRVSRRLHLAKVADQPLPIIVPASAVPEAGNPENGPEPSTDRTPAP